MQGGSRALALLVALALPREARAANVPELALVWQAPATCPSPGDVEAQFARLLGGAARAPSGKHIAATGVVRTPTPERWSLDLTTVLDGGAGKRTLSGDSCASLASAAALILALMIDPAAGERAAAESALAETPPPATVKAPAPPPAVVAAPIATPAPPALTVVARAFAGGVVALLPEPAAAVGVALGARHGRLGAELFFLATQERHGVSPTRADAGGDFRLVAGGARACGALGGRAVIWELCLGGELERLSGTGVGVNNAQSASATMLAGTGGLLVSVPLGAGVALSLDLAGAVRTYHPKFVLRSADQVLHLFQVPAVSALAALGISITI